MKRNNEEYPNRLLEIGIKLLEPYKGSNYHHRMGCLTCDNEWSATPKSKIMNFKKHGHKGCPKCTDKQRHADVRKANLKKINDRGIVILDADYDGKTWLEDKKFLKVRAKNIHCGHEFEVLPSNLIIRDVTCPICNTERKRKLLQQFNHDRQEEYQKTASDWDIYRHEVYQLTRQTYKEHHQTINPNNLFRGKAGVEGAHHLDHIVPVRYCFDNDIPSELCAHHTNLQMLHWNDNVGSRDKLKPDMPIPQILEEFINI